MLKKSKIQYSGTSEQVMNDKLGSKIINLCVVYMEVDEGREQGRGSFVKLRKAIAPACAPYLRPVGNNPAVTCVLRLGSDYFKLQSVRPRLNQSFL